MSVFVCVALAKSTRISVKSENTTSQEPQAKSNAPQSIQQTTIHEILLRIIFQPNSIPVSNGNSATPTSTSTFISASTRAIYHWSSWEWFFFYSDFILVFFVLGCGQSCRSPHSVPVTFYASDIHTHTHTQQAQYDFIATAYTQTHTDTQIWTEERTPKHVRSQKAVLRERVRNRHREWRQSERITVREGDILRAREWVWARERSWRWRCCFLAIASSSFSCIFCTYFIQIFLPVL